MTPQIDKELNDRLLQYARTIAAGDRTLEQTLRTHISRLGSTHKDVISEYEEYLNDSRSWHGKEAQAAKERLIRLKKLEQQAEKARSQQLVADEAFKKKLKDLHQEELAARQTNNATQTAQIRRQMIQLQQSHNDASKHRRAEQELGERASRERLAFERKDLSARAKWNNTFRQSISSTVISGIRTAFGGATISAAVSNIAKETYQGVKQGMSTGGYGVGWLPESAGGSAFNINTMSKFGYGIEQSIQLQADNRRAILSSVNGMNDFVGGLEDAYKQFDFIASPLDRSKIAIDAFTIATRSGIRMSREQATMFARDIKTFSKYTGENATNFTAHIGDIMASSEVQAELMGASNEQQRKAILDSVAAQYTANRAMGMTADQAKNAAVALSKINGEKSKTTLVDAVKIRAYMASIGLGKEGAELQKLMLKRQNLTDAERQRKQELMSQAKNESSKRSWGDVTGGTLSNDAMLQALDVERILPDSLNTNLVKAISPQEKAFDTIPEIPKSVQNVVSKLEEIRAMLQHPLAQLSAGAIGSSLSAFDIASGVGSGMVGGKLTTQLMSNIPGFGTATAAPGIGTSASAASPAAGMSSSGLATTAGRLSLALAPLAAMYGMTKWAEDTSHDKERIESRQDIGQSIESFLGIFGYDKTGEIERRRQANRAELNGDYPTTGKIVDNKQEIPNPTRDAQELAAIADAEKAKAEQASKVEQEQLKNASEANNLLKNIAQNSQRQIELTERQLAAEAEANEDRYNTKSNLRKDGRFGSKYGYV